MSKLPGPEELGQVNPGSGERPVGQIDAQPLARGVEKLGQGLDQFGQGVGEFEQLQGHFQNGLARSGNTADLIDLRNSSLQDPNYGPDADGNDLVARYKNSAGAIRDKWASSIADPATRELFVAHVQPQIEEGAAQVRSHAFALRNNHLDAASLQAGDVLLNKGSSVDDPVTHAQVMRDYGASVDDLVQGGVITEDQGLLRKQRFAGALGDILIRRQADPNIGNDPIGAANHLRAVPGSDAELGERIIQIESGGNPLASSSSSSAAGLGQFTADTWLSLIKSQHPELAQGRSDQDLLALRADPTLSREMVGTLIGQNRASLQSQGLQPSGGNLYLSHFLGAGDAAKLLKADPNTPVAALLDPKVIAANPSILAGKTAGSVTQWSADRMGGYAPGDGSIYSFIPPERRAELLGQLLRQAQAKQVGNRAQLVADQQDAEAEALDTGSVTNPIPQERFIAEYGPEEGARRYQQYDTTVQTGRTIVGLAAMTPDQRRATVESLSPTPGEPGYAIKARAYGAAQSALASLQHEQSTDPAGFAARRLPAVQDAWRKFSSALADPQASDDARRAAARNFATTTTIEQQRVGIQPGEIAIAPKDYVDALSKSFSDAASSDNPQSRAGLIAEVQREAKMWGTDAWPSVMRQLAPATQPVVRAIAAGADPVAMARLLSLPKGESPAQVLAQQNTVKSTALSAAVNDAMAPFLRTMVGRQRDVDYPAYYGLAKELGALYVRDGDEAGTAAAKAFSALIGNRYDFRDSWRMPKSSGVAADDAQAGTLVARSNIADGSISVTPAIDDIGLGDRNATDSREKFARDGRFVTSPDNSGLNLAYGDKFVRGADGKPLLLTWQQLAGLGKGTVPWKSTDVSVAP